MLKLIRKGIGLFLIGLALGALSFLVFAKVTQSRTPALCQQASPPGDYQSYEQGWHQIFDGPLLFGRDDVYETDSGFLQCYCGPEGRGIQTVWERVEEGEVFGEQWNLGKFWYNAENTEYFCGEETSVPSATPRPTPGLTQAGVEVCVGEDVTVAPVYDLSDVARVDATTVQVHWLNGDPHAQSFTVYFGLVGQELEWNKTGIHKEERIALLENLPPNEPIDLMVCAVGACGDEECGPVIDP